MESEENAQWQANPLDHCPGIKPEEFKLEKHQKLYNQRIKVDSGTLPERGCL